ncbi:hypothetical protein CWO91_10315 [Bradyrhizobium genosp. SA-3]|uniref:hypothetical protein n=1 Tax=Bradyrhizobium genosp. SA-3 TaxID=508868 RepID=UPI00102914DC|nr:hypothetical protein [Bradyrhizobium genosp. SA-3]RZN11007.1 hypothetical protein CWO91_10315 [Bradyrhizobium genosp. SA-3]
MAKRSTKRSPPSTADNPITVARLEWCLDRLALVMHRAGKKAEVYLPIYERLESELAAFEAREAKLERARARAARVLKDLQIKE